MTEHKALQYLSRNSRIVLIHTSHPGNIGSAVRAMRTMGLQELYLVSPKRFPAKEATAMASGADELLARVKVVDELDQALQDCHMVWGTSARDRSLPWPMQTPKQAAAEMTTAMRQQKKIALLFGREDVGLSNEELQRCHYHIQISANPDYSSLNLAQAVQVICYELRMAGLAEPVMTPGYDAEIATQEAMELFYQHLEKTLYGIEFLKPENPNRVMPRLRRLFNRARPDDAELAILRGILTEVNRKT